MLIVCTRLIDPVAEALIERALVGAVDNVAKQRLHDPVNRRHDAVDLPQSVAAVTDDAPTRVGQARDVVAGVVGIHRRVGHPQFCVHLLDDITERIVCVFGSARFVLHDTQATDAKCATGADVVDERHVLTGAWVVDGCDAVQGIILVGRCDAPGVGARSHVPGGVMRVNDGPAIGTDLLQEIVEVIVNVVGGGVVGRSHLADSTVNIILIGTHPEERVDRLQQAVQRIIGVGCRWTVVGIGFA